MKSHRVGRLFGQYFSFIIGLLSSTYHHGIIVGKDPAVRLVNGRGKNEGIVEIKRDHNDNWHTACANQVNLEAARVICHTLGFQGG